MTAINNFIQNYLNKFYVPRIEWTDIIEILFIAFVLYSILVWIKDTKAWSLLKGIIVVGVFTIIAYILNLRTILWIASKTISVGIIALVIIFQPELERLNSSEGSVLYQDFLILVKERIKESCLVQRQQKRL